MNISQSEELVIGTIAQGTYAENIDYFLETLNEDCFSTKQYEDFYKL